MKLNTLNYWMEKEADDPILSKRSSNFRQTLTIFINSKIKILNYFKDKFFMAFW